MCKTTEYETPCSGKALMENPILDQGEIKEA